MQRVLSFEQTPPLSVPLRFFLTAPAFALAAAAVLLWQGEAGFVTRWSPVTLALTHLITLGFLAMCMIGALLQILPVVLGIRIPHPRHVAAAAHILLTLGTALLCAAFVTTSAALFQLALPMLLTAFGWLFLVGLRSAWSPAQPSPMLTAIRLALCGLTATVVLGATAASSFGWRLPLPLILITDLHATWGLVGWAGLLIAGVAYQVIPMFQVTPAYPKLVTRWFAGAMFLLLLLWTLASAIEAQRSTAPASVLASALACGLIGFALCTLYLLWKRKRPLADPTTRFWRTSLASLLIASVLWLAQSLLPGPAATQAWALLLGVLLITGFALSAVNGMLYKIVPFLVWYHLQHRLAEGRVKAPNVRQILPDGPAVMQLRVHQAALVLLLGSALWPQWFTRPAALVFGASVVLLWRNLWRAANIHREVMAALPASAVQPS